MGYRQSPSHHINKSPQKQMVAPLRGWVVRWCHAYVAA
jgi:hypothetical protein